MWKIMSNLSIHLTCSPLQRELKSTPQKKKKQKFYLWKERLLSWSLTSHFIIRIWKELLSGLFVSIGADITGGSFSNWDGVDHCNSQVLNTQYKCRNTNTIHKYTVIAVLYRGFILNLRWSGSTVGRWSLFGENQKIRNVKKIKNAITHKDLT